MEHNLFWQAALLLLTGMYCAYQGMKWKEIGDSIHAFWFGIFIMATVMNIKPFM